MPTQRFTTAARPLSLPAPGPAPGAGPASDRLRRAAPPDRGRGVRGTMVLSLMACFLLCLSMVAGLDTSVDTTARPTLQTTWSATYNATGPVTSTCGKYYASYFLQRFLQTQNDLHSKCDATVKINIASVARVRIFHRQIHLSTFLYFDGPMGSVYNCTATLNQTLHDINTLIDVSSIPEDPTTNCSRAIMASTMLKWESEGCRWTCKEDFTLIGNSECQISVPLTNMLGVCLLTVARNTTCATSFTACFSAVLKKDSITCVQVRGALNCITSSRNRKERLYIYCWGEIQTVLERVVAKISQSCPEQRARVAGLTPNTTCTPSPATTPTTTTSTTTTPTTTTTTPTTTTPTTTTLTTTTTPTTTTTTPTTTTTTEPTSTTTTPSPLDWQVQFTPGGGVQTDSEGKHTLTIREGQPREINFITWANVSDICTEMESEGNNCELNIMIGFKSQSGNLPRCNNSDVIEQIAVGEPRLSSGESNKDNFCEIILSDNGRIVTMDSPLNVTIPLLARLDFKYDGNQVIAMTMWLRRDITNGRNGATYLDSKLAVLEITVEDADRKATCQSVNDPHMTTFDGMEYNVFYQGEFTLYKSGENEVHTVYQGCSQTVDASCNCAVAIKVKDDVFVLNRCFLRKKPFFGIDGKQRINNATLLTTTLYKNGDLAEGFKIYEQDDGLTYNVYLPSGTRVKVRVSEELLNVWIYASPNDWEKTEGLCGTYNGNPMDDGVEDGVNTTERPQPRALIERWRIPELYNEREGSLLLGVKASEEPTEENYSCLCPEGGTPCSSSANKEVETCNLYEGEDVTSNFSERAIKRNLGTPPTPAEVLRVRRQIINNMAPSEPIRITAGFIPPDYKWNSIEQQQEAERFCENYIRNSTVGRLCAQIPNVNFDQEIVTCIEDIRITMSMDWAASADDAMKQQCLEELKKNSSIDPDLANQITGAICINQCSGKGDCVQGKCVCNEGFTSVDCSSRVGEPPDTDEIRDYGLCDIRVSDCSRVVVYGTNFINSHQLVCLLYEATVEFTQFNYSTDDPQIDRAHFINFNAVECAIIKLQPYVISVSNDNGTSQSDPLLFIPFDSTCLSCSTNNTFCERMPDACVIQRDCYAKSEHNPQDQCLICQPETTTVDWSIVDDCEYVLPDAVVAAIAAGVGSLVGIALGILLYYLVCSRRISSRKSTDDYSSQGRHNGFKPPTRQHSRDEDWLHRNPGVNTRAFPHNLDDQHHERHEPYIQNYGQGVENGVDDTTYF